MRGLCSLFRKRPMRRIPVVECADRTVVQRKSDGALFTPHHPGYPTINHGFYFLRVRAWRGRWVASGRVVWKFTGYGLFDIIGKKTIWVVGATSPVGGRRIL